MTDTELVLPPLPAGVTRCACDNVGAHPVHGKCINGAELDDPGNLCLTCRASLS